MPTKVLESWAKEAGVSIKIAERYWNQCKIEAKTHFEEESENYWAYVNTCTRGKLGLLHKKKK